MELYLDKVKRKKKIDPKPDEDGPKPPLPKEKKFSDSITDEEERNRFIGYALNNGLPNNLETYNKFVKHTESVLLKGWFNSNSYSDKLLKIISKEIGKEVIRLDIVGENYKYYLENGE
jgi:hypothetical protein